MLLITGATGNNGTEIIKSLSGKGEAIRAMVRKAPGQDSGLPASVEYTVADFNDSGSLSKAMSGVDRAFLVTPSSENVQEQQLRFVDMAKKAGVKHIV